MAAYLSASETEAYSTDINCQLHTLSLKSQGGGRGYYYDTVYFMGRYRYGRAKSGVRLVIEAPLPETYSDCITLYDGNREGIVWNYSIKERDASPFPASCYRYFEKVRRQEGEKYLRERFRIPSTISLDPLSVILEHSARNYRRELMGARKVAEPKRKQALYYGWTGPNFFVDSVPSWGDLPPVICPFPMDFRLTGTTRKFSPVGNEAVCGKRCEVIRGDFNGGATRTFWIDPKTHFILRSEGSQPSFLAGSGNYKWAYSQFEEIPRADARLFALPPGTTVYLPELMWDYPLPPGMTRAKKQGPLKILGFPLYPQG